MTGLTLGKRKIHFIADSNRRNVIELSADSSFIYGHLSIRASRSRQTTIGVLASGFSPRSGFLPLPSSARQSWVTAFVDRLSSYPVDMFAGCPFTGKQTFDDNRLIASDHCLDSEPRCEWHRGIVDELFHKANIMSTLPHCRFARLPTKLVIG